MPNLCDLKIPERKESKMIAERVWGSSARHSHHHHGSLSRVACHSAAKPHTHKKERGKKKMRGKSPMNEETNIMKIISENPNTHTPSGGAATSHIWHRPPAWLNESLERSCRQPTQPLFASNDDDRSTQCACSFQFAVDCCGGLNTSGRPPIAFLVCSTSKRCFSMTVAISLLRWNISC